jgi:hypothetical protein
MGTSFLSADEIQRLITMRIVIPGSLRQILVPVQAEEADREIAEGGHGLRTVPGPDLGSVFVERHIPHPMDLIFDAPMPLHEVQEIVRRGFFRQTTRNAIGVLVSERLAREVGRCAFDPKTLLDMGKPS